MTNSTNDARLYDDATHEFPEGNEGDRTLLQAALTDLVTDLYCQEHQLAPTISVAGSIVNPEIMVVSCCEQIRQLVLGRIKRST